MLRALNNTKVRSLKKLYAVQNRQRKGGNTTTVFTMPGHLIHWCGIQVLFLMTK